MSRHLRLYRLLLRLFPRRFRALRGEEMERLFLDMCRERRRRGQALGPAFWLPLAWDTAWHAFRERLAPGSSEHDSRMGKTTMMTGIWSDLRYAIRSIMAQPLYGAMIVLMMTLGIAGNAAVFRVFNGLFLRPLPFEASERLVDLDVRAPRWNLEYVGMAYADFHQWREENRTFEAMGVFTGGAANFAGDDGAVRVDALRSSHDLPDVLGLEPVLGRFFTPEEDVPDGPRLVLVSHDFWRTRYGGSRDVLGRTAVLDGEPWEIVGVLPPEASFVADAQFWAPLQEEPGQHDSFYLDGVGRLRPGVTTEAAVTDLTAIHKGMVDRFPVNRGTFPRVDYLRSRYLGDYQLGSGVLLGAVAIVLLIACADIAGLMLARSLSRSREVGIRLAMGAPRSRIVRQLLSESLVLAGAGALLGTWVGFKGSSLLVERMAREFPAWVSFDLDWRFVLFTVGATVAAAILFGLAPAIQTSGVSPTETLQASSTRTTASRRRRRFMGLLVGGEVALAMVLLVFGGLTVLDLRELRDVDPGIRTENVLSYALDLPESRYSSDEEVLAFWDRHLERIRALPGVTDAAATAVLPLSGQHSGWFFQVEDAPPRGEDEANPVVLTRAVTPGYMETMGLQLVAGRFLTEMDGREGGVGGAVVNESFVQEFLSHRTDPLNARIRPGGSGEGDPWWTVVGVTRDTKHYGLDEEMRPGVHVPNRHITTSSMNVVARTGSDPTQLLPQVRSTLREQDSQLAIFNVATMDQRLEDSLWTRRASAWLVGVFSAVALLLAVAGLYGVISYGVTQRIQEISIRKALGARQGQVLKEVLGHGMLLVAAGAGVGLAVTLAGASVLEGVLVSVSPTDPVVYLAVTLLLLGVGGLANLLPARRAARLDPMGALRGE